MIYDKQLFTHHDRYHIHKFLGFSCLLHYFIRFHYLLHQPKRKMRQDYYKNIIILLFISSIGVNDRIKATNYNLTVLLKRFVVFVNQFLFYIFLVVHYIPYNN